MTDKFRPYPETHVKGFLMLENMDIHQLPAACDLGIQIAEDGRVWLCVNGVAFIRFTPHANRKMQREEVEGEEV